MGFLKTINLHKSLVNKYHIEPIKGEIKRYCKGKVLDVGCGEKPFYKEVKNQVDEYIGLDHPDSPHDKSNIDVFSTSDNIPFEDNYFDVVLLTQVIEHLEEPSNTLKEIYRVLKPGGILLLAWPFIFPIHEAPRDFFRYSYYGMSHLAKKNKFSVVKIEALSGFWITFFGLLSIYIRGKSKILYILFLIPLLLLKILCLILEKLDKNKNSKLKWTWNYYAVLNK